MSGFDTQTLIAKLNLFELFALIGGRDITTLLLHPHALSRSPSEISLTT